MALAQRLSKIRKRRDLSQWALSEKSNVSFGGIRRLETTGQISLISLTKRCAALDCVEEIKNLFTNQGELGGTIGLEQNDPPIARLFFLRCLLPAGPRFFASGEGERKAPVDVRKKRRFSFRAQWRAGGLRYSA